MVWGCINARGIGILSKAAGKLNGEGYINILEMALIPTTHLRGIPQGWIFQQDNATCHTSRLVQEWFDEEQITVMNWPAQSPDLNPIENLWVRIKERVSEQNPKSSEELWTAVLRAWNGITQRKVMTLIDSMPRRCAAVVKGRRRAHNVLELQW